MVLSCPALECGACVRVYVFPATANPSFLYIRAVGVRMSTVEAPKLGAAVGKAKSEAEASAANQHSGGIKDGKRR